jgi:hypothetical protein
MRSVRWISEDGSGLEHLEFDSSPSGYVVESVLAGDRFEGRYGLIYRVEIDPAWRVTRAVMKRAGGGTLEIRSDTRGNWTDGSGAPLDALRGCIDIDISATPFTNTLPIRRLKLKKGERREIRVAYIKVPAMTVEPDDQAYTCIEPDKRYLYEGLFRHFTAELPVDEDGLVIDYPTLFRRQDA